MPGVNRKSLRLLGVCLLAAICFVSGYGWRTIQHHGDVSASAFSGLMAERNDLQFDCEMARNAYAQEHAGLADYPHWNEYKKAALKKAHLSCGTEPGN